MFRTKNVRVTPLFNNDLSYEWDSFEEYLSDLEEIRLNKQSHYHKCSNPQGRDCRKWYGCSEGFDGVLHRLKFGWPDLLSEIEQMMRGVDLELPIFPSRTTVRKRHVRWDDHGDSVAMDRVWNGRVDKAWRRPARVEHVMPNTKKVTLAFDLSAPWTVTNDMAMWRAALCTTLTDALAKAGRTLEIWVMNCIAHNYVKEAYKPTPPDYLTLSWCVKKPSEPLVMERLCGMTSVGYLRTVGFTSRAAYGDWTIDVGMGYPVFKGFPAQLSERKKNGELIVRIGPCYSKVQMLQHYKAVFEELEEASKENQLETIYG